MKSKLMQLLRYRMTARLSNCIIVFAPKGKGKSWLSLRLCEKLDKNFSLDRVVFSPNEFFALLNKGLPVGSCVVYDEIGVGNNARDAQTRQNKHMSFIAQTIRPHGITIFFTTISFGLVDAQVRNLMDYAINVEGHDVITGKTKFKFFKFRPRPDKPMPDMVHLEFAEAGQPAAKFVSWIANRPTEELAKAYDKKRNAYLHQLYSDADATMNGGDMVRFGQKNIKKEKKERKDLTAIGEKILNNPSEYMIAGKFSPVLIEKKEDVGHTLAKSLITYVNDMKLHTRNVNNVNKILGDAQNQAAPQQ